MLKPIGSLHNIPAPSALVLGESLKLLSTFGDKKAIGALLEQVRDVQTKNEQVFKDAQEAIGSLSVERKELDDSRKAFATVKAEEDIASNQRASALSQAEARLSGKVAAFSDEQAVSKSALHEREKNLTDVAKSIVSRELKCDQAEEAMSIRTAALDKLESSLNLQAQQLQAKEQKLRAALEG